MSTVLAWYNNQLISNPIPTKAISAAILYGIGDLLAQCIERKRNKGFDFFRFLRLFLWGAIFGTIIHYWYLVLSWIHVNNRFIEAFVKMLLDQIIASPIVTGLMFIFNSCLQTCRGQPKKGWNEMVERLWPTMKVSYCIWPFVQIINFLFVKFEYQGIVVNTINMFWNAFLSIQANKVKTINSLDIVKKSSDV